MTSAVIVGGVWITDHRDLVIAQIFNAGSTSSSSVTPEPTKLDVLNGRSETSVQTEHKASGNMQIALTSAEGRKSDGTLSVQAYVTAMADLNDLKYEWVLPEGAVLASGSLSGAFGTVSEGTQVSSSVVLNVPASNAHVFFHAYREVAGEKVGQVASYNTVDQNSINLSLALKRESLQRKPAMSDRRYE